jgi:hypothetical protein
LFVSFVVGLQGCQGWQGKSQSRARQSQIAQKQGQSERHRQEAPHIGRGGGRGKISLYSIGIFQNIFFICSILKVASLLFCSAFTYFIFILFIYLS